MEKVLAAVQHLHIHNVCHRDIKPENFLFEAQDIASEIKLIDFGLSTKYGQESMDTMVGTPYYVAPEVLLGHYGPECDIWSCGVLMYVLLSGTLPFGGENNPEIFNNILNTKF